MLHGESGLHRDRAQRMIKISLQRVDPVVQTPAPFGVHVLHIIRPLWLLS